MFHSAREGEREGEIRHIFVLFLFVRSPELASEMFQFLFLLCHFDVIPSFIFTHCSKNNVCESYVCALRLECEWAKCAASWNGSMLFLVVDLFLVLHFTCPFIIQQLCSRCKTFSKIDDVCVCVRVCVVPYHKCINFIFITLHPFFNVSKIKFGRKNVSFQSFIENICQWSLFRCEEK